jgi:hypothetical protein
MDKESLQRELDAAYKKMDVYEHQIKNLLKERKQNQMVLQMLETADYIEQGKLEEAQELVRSFHS